MSDALNPALTNWTKALGLPDFVAINDDDYGPAMKEALAQDLAEHEAIADQTNAPTFENTIEALERTGDMLSRIASLFFMKAGNHTNDAIQALEREFGPMFARHSGKIAQNKALFERVDTLWKNREALGLSGEQAQVLKRHHRRFTLAGAGLEPEQQKRLIAINEDLASQGTQFGQNVLKDEADWVMVLESEDDLAGLPASLISAMQSAAAERGHEGKHAVTLARSIIEPFLTSSTRADLREKAQKAWTLRGENGGETDNTEVIANTLALRAEKAKLLGYESFADMKLENTMAKTPMAVNELLNTVWEKARAKAEEEAGDIRDLMATDGVNEPLTAAAWRHYDERIREQRFNFSDDDVKPYMQLDRMIEAAFWVAGKLFGLTFEEDKTAPRLHSDSRVWQVRNSDGEHQAVFIGDYFARASKRSGAWMSGLQSQSHLLGHTPIITNTMNFAKPPEGEPAFLSFDDARTLFHEFGHALHGMLSDVTYPSVSGTSVSRDFVELPSQLYEHWLTVPKVLNRFATHVDTGEPIPQTLLDKIMAGRNHGTGFNSVEYTSSAIVDMAYHERADAPEKPLEFEAQTLDAIQMPDAMVMRHRSPHFLHIFSGDGYAAGYYSYLWSEVLDADAFRAFEETGDPFNPEIAEKLKTHIYSAGGKAEPDETYLAFRGKLPSPDAMMEKKGLA